MRRQVWIDQDGVLADFDRLHEAIFGWRADATDPSGNKFWKDFGDEHWHEIAAVPGFYTQIPIMPTARDLWHDVDALIQYHGLPSARILTGVRADMPQFVMDKREWVTTNFGLHAADRMVACVSREKALHCQPGDVIIDDWARYRGFWEAAGGHWILHDPKNVGASILKLNDILQRKKE